MHAQLGPVSCNSSLTERLCRSTAHVCGGLPSHNSLWQLWHAGHACLPRAARLTSACYTVLQVYVHAICMYVLRVIHTNKSRTRVATQSHQMPSQSGRASLNRQSRGEESARSSCSDAFCGNFEAIVGVHPLRRHHGTRGGQSSHTPCSHQCRCIRVNHPQAFAC